MNRLSDRAQIARLQWSFAKGSLLIPKPSRQRVLNVVNPNFGRVPRSCSEHSRRRLGGRLIKGVSAEGTRITRVIPFYGGRGPDIVDVEEKWVSPDLKITVLAKDKTSTNPARKQLRRFENLIAASPTLRSLRFRRTIKVVVK
jgi:hypothetical protein